MSRPMPKMLDERYKVKGELGEGKHAVVYDCFDIDTDERVAVKLLELAPDRARYIRSMFEREVDALEGLSHPAVVRYHRKFVDEAAGRYGIVLERIADGTTLQALIAGDEPPPFTRRIRWRLEQLRSILDGIDVAHTRNVIHRDIKAGNLLFDPDAEQLKLVDFGLARILANYARQDDAAATLRAFHSKPYAAPEQRLERDTHFSTDLYAFGVVMAAVLVWRLPPLDLDSETIDGFLKPLDDALGDAAGALRAIIVALLAEEPARRPKLARVRHAIDAALDGVVERAPIRVRLTDTAKNKAREMGFEGVAGFLTDLSTGLRVEYRRDASEGEGDSGRVFLRCWGQSLEAVLRLDERRAEQLVMVDLLRREPTIHNERREKATLAPFTIEAGDGDGAPLLECAWQAFQRAEQEAVGRSRREALIAVARAVLEIERRRMESLEFTYRLLSDEGQYVVVEIDQLVGAEWRDPRDEEEAERQDAWLQSWGEQLTEESTFSVGSKEVGTGHAYDPTQRALTIHRRNRRPVKKKGRMVCADVAQATALDRQERALADYVEQQTINPDLAPLLLQPDRNRLGERPDVALRQRLVPADVVRDLVERLMAAESFFFVQGPPGTGKTTLITEVMGQLLSADPRARILLTSQSNEAVSNAVDALRRVAEAEQTGWRIVRDASRKAREKDPEIGFDRSFAQWVEGTLARRDTARDASARHIADLEPRIHALSAMDGWFDRVDKARDVRRAWARSVQVWGMTCLRVPTLWSLLEDVRFDWVIIDEAARATPAELMVALIVGRRFILVGDHKQLPPFVATETAEQLRQEGIDPEEARRSLFETLFEQAPRSNKHTLNVQFRMHRSIARLVGDLFYEEVGLETGVDDADRALSLPGFDGPDRVFWVDVDGTERQKPNDTSWHNPAEVQAIESLLLRFEKATRAAGQRHSVGIITPYREQIARIESRLKPGAKRWRALSLRVGTVDAFQGKENDIIVYSMVRARTSLLGFVSDPRRLNVAFSRARRLLVIVGHRETAAGDRKLDRVLRAIPSSNFISQEDAR